MYHDRVHLLRRRRSTIFRNRGALTMDGTTREREWHEAVVLVKRDVRWLIDLVHSRPTSP
jgi:hypothetical protein